MVTDSICQQLTAGVERDRNGRALASPLSSLTDQTVDSTGQRVASPRTLVFAAVTWARPGRVLVLREETALILAVEVVSSVQPAVCLRL